MFLHELSRKVSQSWPIRVDSHEYAELVRMTFNNRCPYCSRDLESVVTVVEHLDGLNRCRAGLHVPGNVLLACKVCNGEKRRDDALAVLFLATYGWESFLSHDGKRCATSCRTCRYWESVWVDETERRLRMTDNLERIRAFRHRFPEFELVLPSLAKTLPTLLAKLYSDCQIFAETEIAAVMAKFDAMSTEQHS
jgi:hypothetical protein